MFIDKLSLRNPSVARFIIHHTRGEVARFSLYIDEVTPGNALRPGLGRQYMSCYWTLLDLPSWFRSSQWGWFYLMFIEARQLKRIPDGIGAVVASLIEKFWDPSGWDMARLGVRMSVGQDTWAVVKISLACFIADEKALKELSSAKGASARKPCIRCANIVGRVDEGADLGDYLLHYSSTNYQGFDLWSSVRLAEAAAVIQEAHRSGVPNRLVKDLERRLGLSYGAGQGILFRPAAIVAQIPDTLFWDSMHTVYAIGGVAQYECNQYAQEIIGLGISRG